MEKGLRQTSRRAGWKCGIRYEADAFETARGTKKQVEKYGDRLVCALPV